jgi:HD-like signal output (HDOD) protein
MNRVLFVDDDAYVLDGLRRMQRPLRPEWHMEFASSGAEALDKLASGGYDVVVSDMRMPGMDGADLLGEVMQRHPQVLRFILSGQADQDTVLRSLGATHQYLSKPCDADTLRSALTRACALRDLLADARVRDIVANVKSIPSLPAVYHRLVKECQAPRSSLQTVAEIISDDVGLTAKILQLVNSSFFGRRRRIVSPLEAVLLLGLETVKALVCLAHVFVQLDESRCPGFSGAALRRHSMAVSTAARLIARAEGMSPAAADEAAVAGVLHDAGELVLAGALPESYGEALSRARERTTPLVAAEMDAVGASHPTVGAYLFALWALPTAVIEAVAFHHEPSRCPHQELSALTAVHAAEIVVGEIEGTGECEPDLEYLARLGVADRQPVWRAACAAIACDEGSHE